MPELKITWGRVVRLWCVLLLWIIAVFIVVLVTFAGVFLVGHLILSWTSSSPGNVERDMGARFGFLFGALLYIFTVLGSVVALRLTLGRRIGDFRVVLVSADPPPNKPASVDGGTAVLSHAEPARPAATEQMRWAKLSCTRALCFF